MTYLSDVMSYLENLCVEHKKLLHNSNGIAFIPMGIDDETGAMVTGIKKTYVKVLGASCTGANQSQIGWEVQVRFLSNMSSTRPKTSEINTAMNLAQEIMLDFDARIRFDLDEGCLFIQRIIEPSMTPVGIVDQNAVGWDYFFRFVADGTTYNPSAWNN